MEEALVPTFAAAVVVRDELGRILLVKENYGRRRWGLPGGVVEPRESPAQAAVREAEEETGLAVELAELIGVYYLRAARPGIRFVFTGRVVGGTLVEGPSDEVAALRWFSPDALPELTTNTAPVAIRDAVAGAHGVYREIDLE